MANLTAREQLMLELINRARMDPKAEAARLDVHLSGTALAPKQVLAGNEQLKLSAYNHSGWMILNNEFSSIEEMGSESFIGATAPLRMQAYGYAFAGSYAYAENISWKGSVVAPDFTALIVAQYEELFHGGNSRARMLNGAYQEAGIGQQAGLFTDGGTEYFTSMVTQDFARSGARVFITGVIYNDVVADNDFYDVGEGAASRKIFAAGAATDRAGAGGGYELVFTTSGIKTIRFDVAGADLKLDVAVGGDNVKVDAVNGREIWTNTSVESRSTAIRELHALGVAKVILIGGDASEKIFGNAVANTLIGQAGNDLLVGQAGSDTLIGGGGKDTLIGGHGHDILTGGGSADVFVYAAATESKPGARDAITDFGDSGADRIDLSGLSSGVLSFVGEAAAGAQQVGITALGKDVIVHINLDTDTADEMQIRLIGTSPGEISAADFIL
jgi:Ca2+-binding RTX toxin-like protein